MKHPTPPPAARRFAGYSSARKRPAIAGKPHSSFHAFIAYGDLPAAKRAITVVNEVLRATAGKFVLKPMLWRFDQLANAKWCDYAITDAREAGVVVLASSQPGPLPLAIEDWLTALLARKRGQRTTIVSLQGADDAWTITLEAPHATGRALAGRRDSLDPARTTGRETAKPLAA